MSSQRTFSEELVTELTCNPELGLDGMIRNIPPAQFSIVDKENKEKKEKMSRRGPGWRDVRLVWPDRARGNPGGMDPGMRRMYGLPPHGGAGGPHGHGHGYGGNPPQSPPGGMRGGAGGSFGGGFGGNPPQGPPGGVHGGGGGSFGPGFGGNPPQGPPGGMHGGAGAGGADEVVELSEDEEVEVEDSHWVWFPWSTVPDNMYEGLRADWPQRQRGARGAQALPAHDRPGREQVLPEPAELGLESFFDNSYFSPEQIGDASLIPEPEDRPAEFYHQFFPPTAPAPPSPPSPPSPHTPEPQLGVEDEPERLADLSSASSPLSSPPSSPLSSPPSSGTSKMSPPPPAKPASSSPSEEVEQAPRRMTRQRANLAQTQATQPIAAPANTPAPRYTAETATRKPKTRKANHVCQECGHAFDRVKRLDHHMESVHSAPSAPPPTGPVLAQTQPAADEPSKKRSRAEAPADRQPRKHAKRDHNPQNDTAAVAARPSSTTSSWLNHPGVPADDHDLFSSAPASSSSAAELVIDPRLLTHQSSHVAENPRTAGSTPAAPIGQPPPTAMGTSTAAHPWGVGSIPAPPVGQSLPSAMGNASSSYALRSRMAQDFSYRDAGGYPASHSRVRRTNTGSLLGDGAVLRNDAGEGREPEETIEKGEESKEKEAEKEAEKAEESSQAQKSLETEQSIQAEEINEAGEQRIEEVEESNQEVAETAEIAEETHVVAEINAPVESTNDAAMNPTPAPPRAPRTTARRQTYRPAYPEARQRSPQYTLAQDMRLLFPAPADMAADYIVQTMADDDDEI
ncbi:hypothetical protein CONLIGDRAFT_714895 [Coniochaeta ligniaria NRRL 30616]|uniref:C2H2-type domain-containing protein n=1 Tax=Coniochaeta ligniaria NRRL 30616 TaxID=1408157 RepID=A0A1J7JF87_9PEZI|nr:hypothetical protein CONLIGDRAFT_714895 [Coniochaeta ligniaria NRRL 30616]